MKSKHFYLHLFELNLAVIFISTSGVLGRYIDLPVPIITLLRALMACIILFLYVRFKGYSAHVSIKDRQAILLGGILLGMHWITYFYSLKMSNVAIGMLSLYTFPTITAILEPLIIKSKFQSGHLVLGVMILFGVYLLVPNFDFESDHFKAVCLGVLSAFCYAMRNIVIKPKVEHYDQSIIMLHQLMVVATMLLPTLYFFDRSNIIENLPSTFLLALLTTAIGHTIFISSLKYFSTISVSIMSSLLPVYGIVLGLIFLHEFPSLNTILGGLVILSTVLIESVRVKKLEDRLAGKQTS